MNYHYILVSEQFGSTFFFCDMCMLCYHRGLKLKPISVSIARKHNSEDNKFSPKLKTYVAPDNIVILLISGEKIQFWFEIVNYFLAIKNYIKFMKIPSMEINGFAYLFCNSKPGKCNAIFFSFISLTQLLLSIRFFLSWYSFLFWWWAWNGSDEPVSYRPLCCWTRMAHFWRNSCGLHHTDSATKRSRFSTVWQVYETVCLLLMLKVNILLVALLILSLKKESLFATLNKFVIDLQILYWFWYFVN